MGTPKKQRKDETERRIEIKIDAYKDSFADTSRKILDRADFIIDMIGQDTEWSHIHHFDLVDVLKAITRDGRTLLDEMEDLTLEHVGEIEFLRAKNGQVNVKGDTLCSGLFASKDETEYEQ